MSKQLSDLNPDGTILGQGPLDRASFYNAVPIAQRGSPLQQIVKADGGMGQVITMKTTGALSPTTIAANTAGESTIPVTGLNSGDFVFSVNKSNGTFSAGLGIAGVRVAGAGSLGINFTNNTGSTITPTASDPYNVVALRGMNPLSITLSPASVAANTQVEQIFNLAPNTAAVLGTPVVNSAGQITAIPITSGGSGYQVAPTVVISTGAPSNDFESGTFTGLGIDPAPTSGSQLQLGPWPAGSGASAVAILGVAGASNAGQVIGIKMTNMGQHYSAVYPPTATLLDGVIVGLGQVCMVNKNAQQAGLGIGNVRVVANNQIGITYINYTGTAIQPTASETYLVVAINDIPAISPWSEVGVTITSTSATATSQTVTEITVTASGVLATDIPGVPVKPTTTAGMAPVGGYCGSNAINVALVNPTGAAVTPAGSEVYTVPILRMAPVAPAKNYIQLLTPQSVAANTTAEQTFTVTGLVFTNSVASTVKVTKPSMTAYLEVVGARVTAAGSLGTRIRTTIQGPLPRPPSTTTSRTFRTWRRQHWAGLRTGQASRSIRPSTRPMSRLSSCTRSGLTRAGNKKHKGAGETPAPIPHLQRRVQG